MTTVAERAGAIAWADAERGMLDAGFARVGELLTAPECAEVRDLYADDRRFRSRIDMARHRFGVGEYKYFDHPLPPLVHELRASLEDYTGGELVIVEQRPPRPGARHRDHPRAG
jgi:hypothetical protein